jgi:hypothetical protein
VSVISAAYPTTRNTHRFSPMTKSKIPRGYRVAVGGKNFAPSWRLRLRRQRLRLAERRVGTLYLVCFKRIAAAGRKPRASRHFETGATGALPRSAPHRDPRLAPRSGARELISKPRDGLVCVLLTLSRRCDREGKKRVEGGERMQRSREYRDEERQALRDVADCA